MSSKSRSISRRKFLKSGLALAGALTIGANNCTVKSGISLEEAVDNADLRQEYIDQLVERESSPYVNRVIYNNLWDPDNRKPPIMTGESIFAEVPSIGIERFATGVKSDVVVYSKLFNKEGIEVKILQGTLTVPLTEELFRGLLQHEYQHAEDAYGGIYLSNGLKIDNSNRLDFNQYVFSFVKETRAHMRQIEFSRQKFGRDHTAYNAQVSNLAHYLYHQTTNILSSEKLPPNYTPYIKHQIDEIKRRIPEVFDVLDLYGFQLNPEMTQ